jgi:hypothetical protein
MIQLTPTQRRSTVSFVLITAELDDLILRAY